MGEERELTEQEMERIEKLMLRDLLNGYEDVIAEKFSPQDITLWRMVHSPLEQRDSLPQDLQDFESLAEALVEYETPSPEGATIEEKEDVVYGLSLSFSDELEPLAQKMWGFYHAKKTEGKRQKFLERLGTKFALYHLTEEDALIENEADDDKHRNVLLNKDVDLEQLKIDEKDFFEYFKDKDDEEHL